MYTPDGSRNTEVKKCIRVTDKNLFEYLGKIVVTDIALFRQLMQRDVPAVMLLYVSKRLLYLLDMFFFEFVRNHFDAILPD